VTLDREAAGTEAREAMPSEERITRHAAITAAEQNEAFIESPDS